MGRNEQVYLATSSGSCQEQVVSTEARVLSVSQENGEVSAGPCQLEYLPDVTLAKSVAFELRQHRSQVVFSEVKASMGLGYILDPSPGGISVPWP